MIHSATSKTSLLAALSFVQAHLLNDLRTPVELLLKLQQSIDEVEWENDPKAYFAKWLEAGGEQELDSFTDAEKLFCAGFNFCQEEMEYQFNLPH